MARLKTQYQQEVAPALMKKFEYKSVMQVPKIDKIVVNVGCGEARENAKVLDAVVSDLSTITGQKMCIRDSCGSHGQQPFQQTGQTVCQQVAVGKLQQLVPRQGKGSGAAVGLGGGVYNAEKQADFLFRGIFLKGQQGVQIHAQCPGQRGQQGNIGVVQPSLPFIDGRGGNAQLACQAFLGPAQSLAAGANDILEFHGDPSLRVMSQL